MAKKGGYRRAGKSAYRMTARRKAALHKAQLISARKRRRNNAIKVGIVAGGLAVAAYGGHKYGGKASDVASSVKRKLNMNNVRNSIAGKISPEMKEQQVLKSAVSPASAARQAEPNKPQNLGATHSAPKPSSKPKGGMSSTFGSWSELSAVPGNATITNLPSAGAVIDPSPPKKPVYPAEHMPTMERILSKLGKNKQDVVQEDLWALSQIWADHKKGAGVKVPGMRNPRQTIYTTMLDMFEMETKGQREARKKAQSQPQ